MARAYEYQTLSFNSNLYEHINFLSDGRVDIPIMDSDGATLARHALTLRGDTNPKNCMASGLLSIVSHIA